MCVCVISVLAARNIRINSPTWLQKIGMMVVDVSKTRRMLVLGGQRKANTACSRWLPAYGRRRGGLGLEQFGSDMPIVCSCHCSIQEFWDLGRWMLGDLCKLGLGHSSANLNLTLNLLWLERRQESNSTVLRAWLRVRFRTVFWVNGWSMSHESCPWAVSGPLCLPRRTMAGLQIDFSTTS